MSEVGRPVEWRRLARLAGLGAAVALGILLAIYAGLMWEDRLSQVGRWRVRLAFLLGLEASYIAAMVLSAVSVPLLLTGLVRARRRGVRRPMLAKGLLLAVSVLVGLGLAELGAWALRARASRAIARVFEGTRVRPRAAPIAVSGADVPLPETFEDEGDGGVELVVLGESSAEGVPFNQFGISPARLVSDRLSEALGRRVNLNVLASSGKTLANQHESLAKVTRRPDVVMVYCGHNEFSARIAAGRERGYYLDRPPPPFWVRVRERFEGISPLCGLIREASELCRVAIPPGRGENRALVDEPAYAPEEFDALLADFRRRLEAIVDWTERVGAVPILVAPAGNDSGFEPNRSYLPSDTPLADRETFAREFRGVRARESSDPSAAEAGYRALLDRYPEFAEAHYRLARVRERAGDFEDAYRHDLLARDLDGLPNRLPTAFQDVYREIGARHDCPVVDMQAILHEVGTDGLLDDELFVDAMHPSLRGQIGLAEAVLRQMRSRGVLGVPPDMPTAIDPAEVARQFELDGWKWGRICLWIGMVYDLLAPAHYDMSARDAKKAVYLAAYEKIAAGSAPESVGLPNIGVRGESMAEDR